MAEFKRLPISEIIIPERLRMVEEEHALAISQSMVEHGQINPITVRYTPAAKNGNYTLVAGAHRIRAVELMGDSDIDCLIVDADKLEAQLIEITENVFRNELSVIDRAIFLSTYRAIWEQKFGKVTRGGDRTAKGQVDPLLGASRCNLLQVLEDEKHEGFSKHVADRMGVSKESVKRLNKIAQNLHPDMRSALRGTAAADNQSQLLAIAKMEPTQQRRLAVAVKVSGDLKTAIAEVEAVQPKPPVTEADKQKAIGEQLRAVWETADSLTRKWFLNDIGVAQEAVEQVFATWKVSK